MIAIERQRKGIEPFAPSWIRSPLVLGSCVVVVAFAAGWAVGNLRPDEAGSKIAYAAGACMALEMAQAHLMIGDRDKAIVADALVGPLNPFQALFPDRRSGVLAVCQEVRGRRLTIID